MKLPFLKFSIILIALYCFLTQTKLVAQNYTFNPGTNFIAAMDTNQLNYDGIRITNTGTTDLDFTWELLLKDTLIDCEFDLCNSGICFNNLPETGIMPTIIPGQQGHLKLHMFSGQSEGINTIKYVLKNSNLSSSDTLTFIINVGNVTGLKDFNKTGIKTFIYPNPTVNEAFVSIDLINQSDITMNVLNNLGQVIYKYASILNAGPNPVYLDTKNYTSGIYTVIISSVSGSVSKKISVNK